MGQSGIWQAIMKILGILLSLQPTFTFATPVTFFGGSSFQQTSYHIHPYPPSFLSLNPFHFPFVPIPSTTEVRPRSVPKLIIRDDGLTIEFLSIPQKCKRPIVNGDLVSVHYVGRLANGTKFDSSYDRRRPVDFVVGKGQVIKGWDLGLLRACNGERRRLVIPPSLGYGDTGAVGLIPTGATLVFEVEIVNIQDGDQDGADEAGFLVL